MKNLLLLLILVSTNLQAAESDADKSVPHSSFAAEQQYKTILETNDKLNLEINQLLGLASGVTKANECLEQQSLNKQAAQASVVMIKSAFQKLKNASPSEEINKNSSSSYRDYDEAYYNVFLNSLNPILNCVDSLSFFIKDGFFGPSGPMVVDDIIESLQRKKSSDANTKQYYDDRFPLPPFDTKFERIYGLVNFINNVPYGTVRKRNDLQPDLMEGANREIDALSVESVSSRFDQVKNSIKKFVETISIQIKKDIENRQVLIVSNNKKLESLDQTMSEQKAQQSALDQRLIYSVWGMIAALVVLFVSVGFFNQSIAEKMIENRSLVEVMSMAFILLTIIILGTGGKIGNEALGALLGTIAGYIFGRQTNDKKSG